MPSPDDGAGSMYADAAPPHGADFGNFTDALCTSDLVVLSLKYKRLHGYVIVVVCVLGILANFANIVVLTRKKMRSAVNRLLTGLAVAELALMCVYLPAGIVYNVAPGMPYPALTYFRADRSSLYFGLFHVKFSMMCHAVAVWETIAVASFRYVHLRFPMRGRQLCSLRNANIATAVIALSSALLSMPNWLSDGVVTASNHSLTRFPYCMRPVDAAAVQAQGLWTIDLTELAKEQPAVVRVNYWLQSVAVRLLPAALLAALTALLVCVLRAAERRRRQLVHAGERDEMRRAAERNRTTGMLLGAVVLVLFVEVPHGVYMMFMLADDSYESVYTILADFIDIAALVAQSLNFFLYTSMSTQFRHTFLALFCKKWAKREDFDWFTTAGRRSVELPRRPLLHGPVSECKTSNGERDGRADAEVGPRGLSEVERLLAFPGALFVDGRCSKAALTLHAGTACHDRMSEVCDTP